MDKAVIHWTLWVLVGIVVWLSVSFLFGFLWILAHRGKEPDED